MGKEQAPIPEDTDEVILRFCLDGVIYSLKQNYLSRDDAVDRLKRWFPDVEILIDGQYHEAR